MLIRRSFLQTTAVALGSAVGLRGARAEDRLPNRPRVPGILKLRARTRKTDGPSETTLTWNVAETGVIICDMWSSHRCKMAAERVARMAPRMNEVVAAARDCGMMVFHCPSDMYDEYDDTPYRKRMKQATYFKPPEEMKRRPPEYEKEGPLPIETDEDGGGGCDDPVIPPKVHGPPWPRKRQHPAILMTGYDGVTQSGAEVYNFCHQEGIKNLAIMGVHTNFCITNRSFGIRQMVRVGMNIVLVRDLTDALYDPRDKPHVSHARGTELMVQHIERHWCPSIEAIDLTKVVPGSA